MKDGWGASVLRSESFCRRGVVSDMERAGSVECRGFACALKEMGIGSAGQSTALRLAEKFGEPHFFVRFCVGAVYSP